MPPTKTSPLTRVLIVDDHPFFREGLAAWIGRQPGFMVCGWAETVADALTTIEALQPEIVLLDLQLRGGDGQEVLQALRKAPFQPRVIILSRKEQVEFADRALRAGACGYVLKDEASDTVLAAMQAALNGQVYVSATLAPQLDPGAGNGDAAKSDPVDRLGGLYNRELQVLQSLGRGRTTKEIARDLGISPKTVESYRESLKKKLGVADSLTLVRLATLWQEQGRLD